MLHICGFLVGYRFDNRNEFGVFMNRLLSIIKTFTYKIVSQLITMGLVYALTRELMLSLGIAGLELILTTVWYYVHERFWEWIVFKKQWINVEDYWDY